MTKYQTGEQHSLSFSRLFIEFLKVATWNTKEEVGESF
jgi:hypothetical protein